MISDQKDLIHWQLALLRTENIGPISFKRIVDSHESIAQYFHHHPVQKSAINWDLIEKDIAWSKLPDCYILTLDHQKYPARLKEIASPPPMLFVQGDPACLSLPQIAMVGSRNPTPVGMDAAYQFAKSFAGEGLTITSGLAMGIDGASHQGALEGKGKTIGVMGTGPDIIYPKRHHASAKKILENGCLVTEFPTGTAPVAMNFPRRNRLISGLSLGTVVVEAAFASGSLVTAKYALEQNREVFALPGSIQNPLARGCHALIKQGAKLVETAQDVLEEIKALCEISPLDTAFSADPLPQISQTLSLKNSSLKDPLLAYIGFESTPIDLIIQRSALTAEKVSSMLLLLELNGSIASVPGGYIRLT